MIGDLPVLVDVAPDLRLSVLPVTAGQYWLYLASTGRHSAPHPELHGFPRTPGSGLRRTEVGGAVLDEEWADLPATSVTWVGALAYCTWSGERLGTGCRLPTAAQWQSAASGPAGWRWALGDEFDRAVYAPPLDGPRPVGSTPPNPFGLRDLTGNVFEWCADTAQVPGSRVIKGGAYTVRNPESFENATVFTADELTTVPYIGFRVAADPSGA